MGLISRVSSRTYRYFSFSTQKPSKNFQPWVCHEMESTSRSTDERRPPPPSLCASKARASSRSTDDHSTKLSQPAYDSSLRSHFSSLARADSAALTSKSRSAVVVELPKSTPSDRLSAAPSSPTTKSTSTSTASES